MSVESGEYKIRLESDGSGASVSGVLRLASPAAYESVLEPLKKGITAAPKFTIDLFDLTFLNSSGITGISRLVLHARSLSKGIEFVVNEGIPWQKKTVGSLQRLNKAVTFRTQR